jgi:hypothetical protein
MPSIITALAVTLVAANAAQVPELSTAVVIAPSAQVSVFQHLACYDYEKPQGQCDLVTHYNITKSKLRKKKKKSHKPSLPYASKKADTCNKIHAECMQSESSNDSVRGEQVKRTLNPVALNWINALNVSNSLLGQIDRCNNDHEECITQE